MRTNTFLPRLVAGATVLVVAGAGLLVATAANAQTPQPPPSGTIAFIPPTGNDTTIVFGTPSGPCDAPGSTAFNVVVSGPGAFAPNPPSRPDGIFFRGIQTDGFTTTDPITFNARLSFRDFAQEAGTTLEPGDYVVTFRCVEEFSGDIFQTYRSTITFDPNPAGGPPNSYRTTTTTTPTPAPGTPTPTPEPGTPTPTPVPGTPTPTPGGVTATTTALTVAPSTAFQGFPVFVNARVAPFNAAGNVQFKDGNTNIGAPAPVFGGFAFILTSTLTQGDHTLTAEFTPTDPAAFGPSTSPSVPLTVRPPFINGVLLFIQSILQSFLGGLRF